MQSSLITTLLLPLALGIIMFGLGLHLRIADFARVLRMPRPVAIGLAAQMLVLPPIAFALCLVFALPKPLAIGLMLLVASPGGAASSSARGRGIATTRSNRSSRARDTFSR
mgnify:CR=1 FL=1